MSTATAPRKAYTDQHGIERSRKQQQKGAVDKAKQKSPALGHLMRMNERYVKEEGNQLAAGITYFSVLALFPLAMLVFSGLGFFLAARPDVLAQIQEQINDAVGGDVGQVISGVVDTAIAQRGAVAGIGLLTTLWSGLGWMNHLRVGISAMWKIDGDEGGNFFSKKLWDLLGLIGLIVLFLLAFGVTALGTSGLTSRLLEFVGLDAVPGSRLLVWVVGLAAGLLANFIVMAWLIIFMPRTKVHFKSGLKGAALGAVAFELIKQFATIIISSASSNPAGAIFGPIIALMVVLYLIWRVVLYVAAWTATTPESLETAPSEIPEPAVINVRSGAAAQARRAKSGPGRALGLGAAAGAIGVGVLALLNRD
ncbi:MULTISPECIES: YhjD/YihY/BrkB family envelope integrity protein [unclassified Corynebacterium]|uniref:YhjD/YihY/BrkB family envelope integrity protein n=1 Tax=unclassified Corynebacterium TaxID=2624378 RepID=UPI002A916391|nr:YhjD/YihY/BrkB family envelope integrity protein [Corynebacterium sp.]MDY5784937.1 YhjD/YihY/BrkB family envelope integrity protein [Corynebacterium sp.]